MMVRRLRITCGGRSYEALLNESRTAEALWAALPITGRASTWGDEIYFSIPLEVEQEADASTEVEVGDIAYWPPGTAFCIFFGPTPASSGTAPVAASPVNVMGRIEGTCDSLREVRARDSVWLERT